MRISVLILVAAVCALQTGSTLAGDPLGASEPAVRGTIRSDALFDDKCLSLPAADIRPGARLEMRRCTNSPDQIFDWNVLSFEITIGKLCVDALRPSDGRSQAGDPVGLWYCQGTPHQHWFPVRTNPYLSALSIVGGSGPISGLCLETQKSGDAGPAPLALAACDGGESQQFRIQPWPPLGDEVSSGIPGPMLLLSLP
jgi:hypothetical protein